MGSGKQKNQKQLSKKSTKTHKNPSPLGPKKSAIISNETAISKRMKTKTKKKKKKGIVNGKESNFSENEQKKEKNEVKTKNDDVIQHPTPSQQLSYFLHQYQSANGIQLSSLELESYKDKSMLELSQGTAQSNLAEHMKIAFGPSFKEVLCEKKLGEGKIDPGNPALLVISLSALRSLELLRELRPLTRECHAVKLFSKHMKIEEQVSFLKNRVNIACGTPNRIKKLIDMEALGLSRLAVIILDMYTDVKGYSLFTLPQVREEFWDLYKSYFHERLLEGDVRICLYSQIPAIPRATEEARFD